MDALKYLPPVKNKWMDIMRDTSLSTEEKIMATYCEAINDPICVKAYEFQNLPPFPNGFQDDYSAYERVAEDKIEAAWMKLQRKYSGYFKSLRAVEIENASNLAFLKEMLKAFEDRKMMQYAEKCRLLIQSHQRGW
jgi:hypothetical protein